QQEILAGPSMLPQLRQVMEGMQWQQDGPRFRFELSMDDAQVRSLIQMAAGFVGLLGRGLTNAFNPPATPPVTTPSPAPAPPAPPTATP
ncbi:MAG: hypothetical protein AAF411_29925, partial [Myxococcota bacterium]